MKIHKIATLILLLGFVNVGFGDEFIEIYTIKNPFTDQKEMELTYLRKIVTQKKDQYIVQDFYLSGLKRSLPYNLMGKEGLNSNDSSFIQGDYTELYENGNKKYHLFIKNGMGQGIATTWYDNGEKKTEYYLVDNIMEGAFTAWHPNGVKSVSGKLSNEKQIGVWISWDEEGNKTSENYWNSLGKKYKRLEFDKQGNIIKEIKFEDKSVKSKE